MDQRILPQEIIKIILSSLDDKSKRNARLVSTEWFRWIKYAKFDIYFATPTLLPEIVDRLSTYQYPIELSLHKPLKLHDRDILDCISKLTQLKEFNLWDFYYATPERRAEPQEYFKLSNLTNLEMLNFGSDRYLPPELMQHFPRMRQCNNIDDSKEDIQIINTHCPYYQYMSVEGTFLSIVPVSLTELGVHIYLTDPPPTTLTRLTRLKKLEISMDSDSNIIDLRHVTWLGHLKVETINVTGLEYSHHLTELFIEDPTTTDASTLFKSLTALPKLQKLGLNLPEPVELTLPTLSSLNSLYLYCKCADIALLPTKMQELDFNFKGQAFELSNLSHLVHLTRLSVQNCITTASEPIHTLTKLEEMKLDLTSQQSISFSTLDRLTSIFLRNAQIDSQTVKSLTNLQRWNTSTPPTDQAAIDNLQYLSHLTYLWVGWLDYKVIEKLPLAYLQVQMKNLKNCWTVLPTLTTLEDLTIQLVEDEENIASLVKLNKLIRLSVMKVADNVTCVHLTRLTTLQQLNLHFPNAFSFSELSLKLTRLLNVWIAK